MSAYYNDINAYAVEWLQELIRHGAIAPGEVDARSIEDVQADELIRYRQVHLFAGVGGWCYALRLAGWPDGQAVWSVSCPCQAWSTAGRKKGARDKRHLWPAAYRLISKCRPPVIFGEQVANGLGKLWFSAVRSDLEKAGYAVGAAHLPAGGIGAPQQRMRTLFVAGAASARAVRTAGAVQPADGRPNRTQSGECLGGGGVPKQLASASSATSQRDAGKLLEAQASVNSAGQSDGSGDLRYSDGGDPVKLASAAIDGQARGLPHAGGVEHGREAGGLFQPARDCLAERLAGRHRN